LRCKEILGVLADEREEEVKKEAWEELLTRITGVDPRICPICGKGKMILKEILLPQYGRWPP